MPPSLVTAWHAPPATYALPARRPLSAPRSCAGTPPSGRVGHTITAVGSRLLVLGGREYTTNHFDSSLHSFNVRSKCWSQVHLESLIPGVQRPPVRTGHCTTVHAGRLLLFGGLRDDGHFLDDISAVTFMR